MAELDYAFLAEYAGVTSNRLNVVGASYTLIETDRLPTDHLLSIGGRVRAPHGTEQVNLNIVIRAPMESYEIQFESILEPDKDTAPYDGKVGILFAVSGVVPLSAAGLYEVLLALDGVQVRRLAFEVTAPIP